MLGTDLTLGPVVRAKLELVLVGAKALEPVRLSQRSSKRRSE